MFRLGKRDPKQLVGGTVFPLLTAVVDERLRENLVALHGQVNSSWDIVKDENRE